MCMCMCRVCARRVVPDKYANELWCYGICTGKRLPIKVPVTYYDLLLDSVSLYVHI